MQIPPDIRQHLKTQSAGTGSVHIMQQGQCRHGLCCAWRGQEMVHLITPHSCIGVVLKLAQNLMAAVLVFCLQNRLNQLRDIQC